MATSQSTTNDPSSRRTSSSSARPPLPPFDEDVEPADPRGGGAAGDGGYLLGPAYEAIETERGRLMAADSVLACLEIAMDREAVTTDPPPYFPDVVQIARKLINQSIRRLDCREIGPLIDREQAHRS
jgi:hypothetical protein